MSLISSWAKRIRDSFSQSTKKLKQFEKQHHLDSHLVRSLNRSRWPSLKQLKHFSKILAKREKRQIAWLSLVTLICLIILGGKLYLVMTVSQPASGGEYSEGLVGAPRFINPILAQTNDVDLDISRLVFSGLMRQDKDHQLTPDLAESYEVSPDQLVYTFHLKKNVKWHDGEPFNADDVVFTIASIQDPQFKSPLDRSWLGVTAEKVDDYTVKFSLKEPYAPFLGLLTVGILPEHLWYNVPPANADLTELNKKPIGTGAWQFDSFKKDNKTGAIRSFTLTRNPNFYGPKPLLDKIIFKFYGDFVSAVDALKSNTIDAMAYLPKDFKADLKRYKNINYFQLDQPQYTAVFFNQSQNDLLKADYVRQVLALAIDKNKIINEAYNGEGRALDSLNLPGIETNPDIIKYPYDQVAAIALLEKNGWPMVATTTAEGITEHFRQKKGWSLSITLTTVDQPEYVKTAEIIQNAWQQIGVQVDLVIVDKAKIVSEVIKTRNYQALLFGEILGADPDPFSFWHSSQSDYPGLNLALFSDKNADKLLEDARRTNDWETRKKDYLEFQKILANALPAIFLYNPTYTYPQSKDLHGFDLTSIASPADRFANIDEWYVKTKRVWK